MLWFFHGAKLLATYYTVFKHMLQSGYNPQKLSV